MGVRWLGGWVGGARQTTPPPTHTQTHATRLPVAHLHSGGVQPPLLLRLPQRSHARNTLPLKHTQHAPQILYMYMYTSGPPAAHLRSGGVQPELLLRLPQRSHRVVAAVGVVAAAAGEAHLAWGEGGQGGAGGAGEGGVNRGWGGEESQRGGQRVEDCVPTSNTERKQPPPSEPRGSHV